MGGELQPGSGKRERDRIYSMRRGQRERRDERRRSALERIALDQAAADRARALEQLRARDDAAEILVVVLPRERFLPARAHPLEKPAHAALGEVVAVLRAAGGDEHGAPRARPLRAERVA